MEGVPEAQRLEAAGGGARELDRDFDGVAAAGGEEHAAGVTGKCLEACPERLGEFNGAFAREAPRRETECIELSFDGRDDFRMCMADVVHVVAMEIHVAPAGHVFDMQALGFHDRRQAGRRDRLVQEGGVIAFEQRAAGGVEMRGLPRGARGEVER